MSSENSGSRFNHSEIGDRDEHLGSVMVEMLVKRFRYILDGAQNSSLDSNSRDLDRLDSLERELFLAGKNSQRQIKNWLMRRTGTMATADLVVKNNRKRKAADN